jgi:tetratricopeptide (TPR) repeat protein
MARRRRLNKNLVAGLTITGIVLSVVIVAVATLQATKRDPEVFAAEARELEERDPDEAIRLYLNAYDVNKEVPYMVEAARCAYEIGEIGDAIGLLDRANAERPDDPDVLHAMLERLWELKVYEPGRPLSMLRDYSEDALKLNPDDVLALVCRATALDAVADEGPDNARLADDAIEHATELDETNPRVAVTRAARLLRQATEILRATQPGTISPDVERQIEELYTRTEGILQQALQANPGNWELVDPYAQVLQQRGQADRCRQVLEEALLARPEDVDLKLALAQHLLFEAIGKRTELSADEINRLLERSYAYVSEALEAEPALYEGYIVLVRLKLFRSELEATSPAERVECYAPALNIYRGALQETVGLRSIRAALGVIARAQVFYEAFRDAVKYYATVPDELPPELRRKHREQALEYAREFQQGAAVEFPTSFVVPLMRGELAAWDGDIRAAIAAYVQAEKETRRGWPRFNLDAVERLANLYLQAGESGSALAYADQAIELYRREGREPPLHLWLAKFRVLNTLDRSQEVLDLGEPLRERYPDDPRLRELLAVAYTKENRGSEATELFTAASAEDVGALITQARLAAYREDYAVAESHLHKVLDTDPQSVGPARLVEATRLYVQVMVRTERRDEAREYLRALSQKVDADKYGRHLDALDVVLSTADPEERDAKLLEIIESIPDTAQRASDLYNYYAARKSYEQAARCLDEFEKHELEKAEPDDRVLPAIFDQQFTLALLRGQFDRAEQYSTRLTESNADGAGGAVYRGRLALARNAPEQALREFYTAQRDLPGNSDLNVYIARAMLASSPPRFEEALEPLGQACKANPRHFLANKLMFVVLRALGRSDEGIPYLERAAKENPGDDLVREQSEFLEEESNPQAGIDTRQKLREQEPENVANLVRLAELHMKVADQARGAAEEARGAAADTQVEDCLQAALAIEPGHREAAMMAARFFASRGKREAGEQFLGKHLAALQDAARLDGQVLLARFYEQLGDLAAAFNCYQEAERLVDQVAGDAAAQRQAHMSIGFELLKFRHRSRQRARTPEQGVQLAEALVEAARHVLTLIGPDDTSRIQRARLWLIEGLLDLGRLGDAEKEVDEYARAFPDEPRGLTARAQLLLGRKELDGAREVLTRVLQDEPANVLCLYLRGTVNMGLGRYDEAREDLLKAKQADPQGRLGLAQRRALATLYETRQQVALAETEWRELIELQPDNTEFPQRLIRLYRSVNQLDKAQEVASEFMARQPKQALWPYQLAQLLIERQEFSAAAGYLKTASELSGHRQPGVIAEWVRALTRAQRAAEAVQVFEGLGAGQLSMMVRANVAEAYLALRQLPQANQQIITALTEACDRGLPELASVSSRVLEIVSPRNGVPLLRRLLDENAGNVVRAARLRVVLAPYVIEVVGPADGLEMLEPVLAQAPTGSPERITALLGQARALELLEDEQGMVKAYEQVLEQDPGNLLALNNLAYALADHFKRFSEALLYAERARQAERPTPEVLDTVGWVYSLNDRDAEAESIFMEALRIDPDFLPARLHLGMIYKKLGRIAEARKVLREVIERAQRQGSTADEQQAREAMDELP